MLARVTHNGATTRNALACLPGRADTAILHYTKKHFHRWRAGVISPHLHHCETGNNSDARISANNGGLIRASRFFSYLHIMRVIHDAQDVAERVND